MIKKVLLPETKALQAIIHQKRTFANVVHTLSNDKNCVSFFDNVFRRAAEYDELEHMERYYFKKDVLDMCPILNSLPAALESMEHHKDLSGEEIMTPCLHFNDSMGRTLMFIMGHIPVVDAIYLRIKDDGILKYAESDVGMLEEFREERLRKYGLFSKRHPEDTDFIDYKMRHDYSKEFIPVDNKSEINILYQTVKNSKDPYQIKMRMGSMYWDNIREKNKESLENMGKVISSLASSFDDQSRDEDGVGRPPCGDATP